MTIPIAPNLTGINSPNNNRSFSHSRHRSCDSKGRIKSLERPLSPIVGSHNFEKKRHTLYPKTD